MPGEGAQVGKAYVRVLPDTKGFGKDLESQVDHESSGIAKAFGGIGKAAGAALTLGSVAAVGAGVAMLSIGTQTQEALNIFEVAAHATGDEMTRVSDLARDLGNDVMLPGASAKDAAIAMSELAKAGFTVQESMDAAKGTLQLAAAAGVDAGLAAQISSNSINAFGLSASDAARVSDLLAGAANSASGEITDVAQALQMSGSVFAAAGVPIEDLTTAIAEMANQGILGSDAGTSLKTMLISLQAPSTKAAKLMGELGVAAYDELGNMKPLRDIIANFSEVLPTMSQEQRDSALATIFGTDAVRAANIVLGEGVEGFDAMKTAVTEQGAAQKVAEARMKGVGGAIEGLKSQLETLALDGFNLLAPYAEAFIRWLSDALPKGLAIAGDVFGELVRWLQKTGRSVAEFIALVVDIWNNPDITSDGWVGVVEQVVSALRGIYDWIIDHWPDIAEAFEAAWSVVQSGFEWLLDHKEVLVAALAVLTVATVAYYNATAAAATAEAAAATAAAAPTLLAIAPAVALAAAIAALAAAAVYAYKNFEGFRRVVDGVVKWLVQNVWPAIKTFFAQVVTTIASFAKGWADRWEDIKASVMTVLTILKVAVAAALAPIIFVWTQAHDQIMAVVQNVWNFIKAYVEAALKVIQGIIDVVLGVLSGDWGRAWDGIKAILQGVWDGIVALLTLALENAKQILIAALEIIKGLWQLAWDGIKAAVSAAWEGIKSAVSTGIDAVVAFFQGLPGRAVDALATLDGLLYNAMSTAMTAFKGVVVDFIDQVIGFFASIPERAVDAMSSLGSRLKDAIVEGFKWAWNSAADIINGITSHIPTLHIPGTDIDFEAPTIPHLATGAYIKDAVVAQLHPNEVVLNNKQAARVMWSMANGSVVPSGSVTNEAPSIYTTINGVTDPGEAARRNVQEMTWALRTRAA